VHALKDPTDNGGWSSLDVSGSGLASDLAREKKRWECVGSLSHVTLPAVMNELENLGHRPAPQPEGLNVTMRDYQLATLGFMVDQETLPGGMHRHFWAPVPHRRAIPAQLQYRPWGNGGALTSNSLPAAHHRIDKKQPTGLVTTWCKTTCLLMGPPRAGKISIRWHEAGTSSRDVHLFCPRLQHPSR